MNQPSIGAVKVSPAWIGETTSSVRITLGPLQPVKLVEIVNTVARSGSAITARDVQFGLFITLAVLGGWVLAPLRPPLEPPEHQRY